MRRSVIATAVVSALGAIPSSPTFADTTLVFYGHADLSIDSADNGLKMADPATHGFPGGTNASSTIDPTSTGRVGWQSQISSNLSRLGVRGSSDLGGGLKTVFQIETSVDISAEPGGKDGLAGRNSFIGLASSSWGAVKIGKTDLPYKLSTGRMDPFSATIGDYNSIMGNTGGDNRAEFDTRQPHVVWYESPNWGGMRVNVAFSPGQNRNPGNVGAPQGEANCPGGHLAPPATSNPGGGVPGVNPNLTGSADTPLCVDGAFHNVFSAAFLYSGGPLYAIAAYELHTQVNRIGDEASSGPVSYAAANPSAAPGSIVGIGDERAWKVGVQYKIASSTINAIYENMHRDAPVSAFNERQRSGTWLALTQKISATDDVNVGWAHAGKTPGDPLIVNGAGIDNTSNMYALGYKHHFSDKHTTWYAVAATQRNHKDAHFDLGASGHGATIDCHDNTLPSQTCYPGNIIKAISVGFTYDF
ncbi:MAG TPA: porin [Burkholderiales bacterium]|nr:porin [Burkholderiales bacterium]